MTGTNSKLTPEISGLTLARYNSPLAFIGPFGVLTGMAGFSIFRPLGRQTENQLGLENNRAVLIGNNLSSIPYIFLGLAWFTFIGSMVTVSAYATYGSAAAGGLTGGYLASRLDKHREDFYNFIDKLINN